MTGILKANSFNLVQAEHQQNMYTQLLPPALAATAYNSSNPGYEQQGSYMTQPGMMPQGGMMPPQGFY
jgi:hypothetical protein